MIEAPTFSHAVLGHDQALKQVTEAFASKRMHHAWMIAGIEGIGKSTLAFHIANHVLSSGQNPLGRLDLQHRITKLVMAEAHPDMLIIRRTSDDRTGEVRNVIIVDDVLKVASFLHKTSTHGGWRVVIIDEAHTLNRHGQNAILKILEEPPTRALIIMTTTTPGALLATIRSRSRLLSMAPLDASHMKAVLSQSASQHGEGDLERLIELSNGSLGFALTIVRTESLPLYDELISLLREMPHPETPRLHKLADQISRKASIECFDVLTTLLLNYLRKFILSQARQQKREEAFGRQLRLWEQVGTIFANTHKGNLDRKLAFINVMTELANFL